jgi:hypothetical protein
MRRLTFWHAPEPILARSGLPGVATTVLVCAVVLAGLPVMADLPPGTKAPTAQETALFNAKLTRLKANKAAMPIAADDVLSSLTTTVTRSFTCPPSTENVADSVTINITTTLVHWDPALAEPNSQGTYKWNATPQIDSGTKTVTCQNWVMLDPASASTEEGNPPLGPVGDEALLYHELLHGQLLIAEMAQAEWQAKACRCIFDDTAADAKHVKILPAADGYIEARAPGVNATLQHVDPKQAEASGKFEIDLGPATKEDWEFYILEPSTGSNVDVGGIDVVWKNGHFFLTGRLLDPKKPGKFFLRLDPPDEWIFAGLNEAIVVLAPDGLPVPAVTPPLLAILIAAIFLFAYRRLRGRHAAGKDA